MAKKKAKKSAKAVPVPKEKARTSRCGILMHLFLLGASALTALLFVQGFTMQWQHGSLLEPFVLYAFGFAMLGVLKHSCKGMCKV